METHILLRIFQAVWLSAMAYYLYREYKKNKNK